MTCKMPLHCGKRGFCVLRYTATRLLHREGNFADNEYRKDVCKRIGLNNSFNEIDVEEFIARKCGVDSLAHEKGRDELKAPTITELSPVEQPEHMGRN